MKQLKFNLSAAIVLAAFAYFLGRVLYEVFN